MHRPRLAGRAPALARPMPAAGGGTFAAAGSTPACRIDTDSVVAAPCHGRRDATDGEPVGLRLAVSAIGQGGAPAGAGREMRRADRWAVRRGSIHCFDPGLAYTYSKTDNFFAGRTVIFVQDVGSSIVETEAHPEAGDARGRRPGSASTRSVDVDRRGRRPMLRALPVAGIQAEWVRGSKADD